jgi:hypothetical protein
MSSSHDSQPHGDMPPAQLRMVPNRTRLELTRASVEPSSTTRETPPCEAASKRWAGAAWPGASGPWPASLLDSS